MQCKQTFTKRFTLSTPLRMYLFIVENELHSVIFPNMKLPFAYTCASMVSNCTGERSFSKMRTIRNYLRSSIGQEKLSMQSLVSIQHEFFEIRTRRHSSTISCAKEYGVMKLLAADFLSKSTHWQREKDQGHFNKFVTKYSSQSNGFAITV